MSSCFGGSTTVRFIRSFLFAMAFVLAFVAFVPATTLAGTVIIVDGPNVDTGGATINDAYLQTQLATGSVVIDTNGLGNGPDDIRIEPGVILSWTSAHSLTLRAQNDIVISGTLQHDGPASGEGGLVLLADTDAASGGAVIVGTGAQAVGVAAGSRFGLTRISAADLILQGGSAGVKPYAQVGFIGNGQDSTYLVGGSISVTVMNNISVTSGAIQDAYSQIGNGGFDVNGSYAGGHALDVNANVVFRGGTANGAYARFGNGGSGTDGSHGGDLMLISGGTVSFEGGAGKSAYAQMGNGGNFADGDHHGSHILTASGSIFFLGNGDNAFAQYGNGGWASYGNHTGGHSLRSDGNVTFMGGNVWYSHAQFGNGGYYARGNHSGNHELSVAGDVFFVGTASYAYAQFGNSACEASGNLIGSHTLSADGNVVFQAGSGSKAYAQLGNGGYYYYRTSSTHHGNHNIIVGGNIVFKGGDAQDSFAQLGNGGVVLRGDHSGDLTVTAKNLSLESGSGRSAYAQFGNGGYYTHGNFSGQLDIRSTGYVSVTRGNGNGAYTLIGHGSDAREYPGENGTGTRTGDVLFRVGETAIFTDTRLGHLTASGSFSITQSNTLIGISQTDLSPNGVGLLIVGGSTQFVSAPTANGGELRVYLPQRDNQRIPTTATFNGEAFALANTIPDANIGGFALFGEGSFVPNYTFFFSPQVAATIAITKVVVGAAPDGDWQFTGSDGIGGFHLPAPGGSRTFTQLQSAVVYTITENMRDTYAPSVNCTNGLSGANSIAIAPAPGESIGCTFTNTYVSPGVMTQTLTVNKVVSGGPLTPGDFPLFVNGQPVQNGLPVLLAVGTYTVTETSTSSYNASFSGDCNATGIVNLAAGQHAVCLLSNTYVPPGAETGHVAGIVFSDLNGDGERDSGEPGIEQAQVTLTNEVETAGSDASTYLATTTTGEDGVYGFQNVPVGGYTIQIEPPPGYPAPGDKTIIVQQGSTLDVAPIAVAQNAETLFLPVVQR